MSERRITVWVQRFKDRPALVLQWLDPETGRRKSKSAGTSDPDRAEEKRKDHEYELNHGLYQEASSISWERFRELFEDEFLPGRRPFTRRNYAATLDHFERICKPRRVRAITERTVSAFAAGLRKSASRINKAGMQPSTVKVRLQFLHTVLT